MTLRERTNSLALFSGARKFAAAVWMIDMPCSTASDIWKKYNEMGTTHNCHRSGRPKKIDDCCDSLRAETGRILEQWTSKLGTGWTWVHRGVQSSCGSPRPLSGSAVRGDSGVEQLHSKQEELCRSGQSGSVVEL